MFGHMADEMIGTSILRLVPADRHHEERQILEQFRQGKKVNPFETLRQTKDGRLLEVSIAASPIKDATGRVIGASRIARDIAALKAHEREIARLSQLYAALSQINQALVWMPTREELFSKICQALVEHGGFGMAWIGWRDASSLRLVPVAECGDENGYLKTIEVYTTDRPEGRGPAGTAFRTQRSYVCNDLFDDPNIVPWRPELLRRGWHAAAAFPIRTKDEVCGVLTVYALQAGFFREKEIALLEEAAKDISFALDNLARDEARRDAEAVARAEKQFSDTMIESMPGILYFYDDQGRFLRWNRNFETVSGYSGEEISRMHPLDFFASAEQPVLRARIAEVFARGQSSVEAPFRSKDGRKTPYFFTGREVLFEGKACLVGMGIDISERKQAEDLLAQSERKYRELVEHANSIILRWNSEGRITLLNEFGQRFFGYSAEEILGREVMGTIVPATESSGRDLQRLMEEICAAPEAFEQNINENMRRNGERVWISWTNRVERDEQGRVLEILSIGTDITERRQAEQAVRELNASLERRVVERTAELQSALIRAEAADRLKSAFLATMSHELRTPLNSIIGFTGAVLLGIPGPLNEEQAKQLGMVRSSARHLLELINDVLDLSKIEAGQLRVRAESFDLRTSLEHATALVKVLADKKGLVLTANVAPEIGGMVSDRRRVEQIVLNLLNNAIKFTDRGTVTLTAGLEADFRPSPVAPPQSAVRIEVADTGIGIKPEHLTDLFQPFRQVETGLTRPHEGTGLGLVICQRLVALLGGTISVTSAWSRGSEFTVILPLRKPPDL
jgi:PAS domain S-box-containing protein